MFKTDCNNLLPPYFNGQFFNKAYINRYTFLYISINCIFKYYNLEILYINDENKDFVFNLLFNSIIYFLFSFVIFFIIGI